MNTWRIGILALIVVVVLIALNQMNSKKELESKIDLALAGEHRSEKNKNRDQY